MNFKYGGGVYKPPKGKGGGGCKGQAKGCSDSFGMGGFSAMMNSAMMGFDSGMMGGFDSGMMGGMKGDKYAGMQEMMYQMMAGMGGKCGKGGNFGKGNKGRNQDSNHTFLVQRVKMVQKTPEGKEKWAEFITLKGGGKRDPALRSSDELKEFLIQEDPDAYSYAADVHVEPPTEAQQLAAQIRMGQKNSEEFKEAWWQYVENSGSQFRDPSRHDQEFLQGFLAIAPSYEAPGGQHDPEHESLVARIKEGQRGSVEFKTAWQEYCNMMGQSKFDPTRHNADFIRGFLEGILGDGEKPPKQQKTSYNSWVQEE